MKIDKRIDLYARKKKNTILIGNRLLEIGIDTSSGFLYSMLNRVTNT